MKCFIITPVGPGHQKLAERSAESVRRSFASGRGKFSAVEILAVDDTEGKLGRSAARNQAVRTAVQQGADWLFFLDADDVMAPNAFVAVTEYLDTHDAIWGEIYELKTVGGSQPLRRERQISPINDIAQVLINDPFLTLQMGHFVRAKTALEFPFVESLDVGEDFEYYLRIWKGRRCIKIEQPLFFNVRGQHSVGPRAATGVNWRWAMVEVFGQFCRDNNIVATVKRKNREVRFHISNTLDLIQRELIHGRFFEEKELGELLPNIPAGARVLDVGSNIGNHALFLTCCGGASLVHCYEPTPNTAELLERNFALNKIDPARYSVRRVGVGAGKTTAKVCAPNEANIGANFLKKEEGGDIPVDSLDNLYAAGELFDFLKIDVEGMELEVLAGAKAFLERSWPTILIEVSNANKSEFLAWLFKAGYKVHRVFELVNASNYLLLPEVPREGFFAKGAAELMPLEPRVPLAQGQHPLGWSMSAFLKTLLNGRHGVELASLEGGREILKDIQTGSAIAGTGTLEDFCRDKPELVLVLNGILGSLDDAALGKLLGRLSTCARKVVFVDIMDARWQNTYATGYHLRDSEQCVMLAGSLGYRLVRYQKLPHKAAFMQHHQLDARVTLLEFEK